MAQVLYRKYRPQTFADVADQIHIRVTLEQQIATGKVGHAYLFCGPRGVSKTTIARILAKSMNCENRKDGTSEPCNTCRSCQDILQARSLDVIEIDAASHTGVDNVRENIIENARFTPTQSKYKVFIIDEVHMLSTSAFNALLKTLEEPPAYVLFMLVTTEIHKIPATIISRCQRFDFKKINTPAVIETLQKIAMNEGREIEQGVFESIARFADGCLRDALSLLDQVLALGDARITREQVELILPPSHFSQILEIATFLGKRDPENALLTVNKLVESGVDVLHFTDSLIEFFRKVLWSKVVTTESAFLGDVSESELVQIQEIMSLFDVRDVVMILQQLLKRRQEIRTSVVDQLPLEIACVEICQRKNEFTPRTAAFVEHVANTTPQNPVEVSSSEEKKTSLTDAQEDKITTSPIELNIESVHRVWNSLVLTLAEEHHSLSLLLKVGRPLELRGRTLVIGFQFKLHQSRVNEMKNRAVVSETLSRIVGTKLDITSEVSDKARIEILPLEEMVSAEIGGGEEDMNDSEIASVLREFGGKVI